MKQLSIRLFVCGLLAAAALGVQAQLPGAGGPSGGVNAAMMRLYGDVKGFTAKVDMRMTEKSGAEVTSMVMGMAFADKKVRMEIDLTQMKSAMLPAEAAGMMKQMGMDKITTLVLPDKKQMIMVYPGLLAYLEMPIPAEDAKASDSDFKTETKEIGKETIDGHACIKNKVTITDGTGTKVEATTWNAEDMKKFPIQIQMDDKGTTILTKYKDVKFVMPDAKQFEAPASYKKCASQNELMMVAQQKMMGGATPGK